MHTMTDELLTRIKGDSFQEGVRYALEYLSEVYGESIEETDLWADYMTTCDDCDAFTDITFEPYGEGKMAVINCPNCGVSYDTNLDESEGKL